MNYLYFKEGVASCKSATAYPASALRGIRQESGAATSLKFYFTPANITKVVNGDQVDIITATLSSADKAETSMHEVVKAINKPVKVTKGMVDIADDENGIYIDGISELDEDRVGGARSVIVLAS